MSGATLPAQTLFEVSWEVCNKVGGIHTVISTKAKALVARLSDDYVTVGPWLLTGGQPPPAFEEEAEHGAFCERMRAQGVPVRVGRWRIPGRPRTILVEFSSLYEHKDKILARLWEDWKVDSIEGQWDYVEPILFGWAAGLVIAAWAEEHCTLRGRVPVAQFHEWMTGAGLLRLKQEAPSVGLVFTTHATMLGRSISSTGTAPARAAETQTVVDLARTHGVVAKHSMETVCAREADVFTTVSAVTGAEAEQLLGRKPDPILPNGIDLEVVDELRGPQPREQVAARLRGLAERMLGRAVGDAALVATSGRYEFHNKGLDLLLDSAAELAKRPGRPIVVFVLVPAGNSGVRAELLARLGKPLDPAWGPVGLCTHNLFDFEKDALTKHAAKLGLTNKKDARVTLVHVPIYLAEGDGLLDLSYEAVLGAVDLSVFPSFYEPWGYTPQESLAVGVPTITSDCAGFGRWARDQRLGPGDGVQVLQREGVTDAPELARRLAGLIEIALSEQRDAPARAEACRRTARLTSWSDLLRNYDQAFARAASAAAKRAPTALQTAFRMRQTIEVVPPQEGHRPRLKPFRISATLPEPLRGLERLSRNLWWSWEPDAHAVFRDISPDRWFAQRHNPISFLRNLPADVLERATADRKLLARVEQALRRFDAYMAEPPRTWDRDGAPAISPKTPVAYFSAEFGVHESLCIYSGGLGILAGDHLKSASDLCLPLVGVGLFYRAGYFTQRLTPAGEQISAESEVDPRDLPLEQVHGADGRPLTIHLQLPSSNLILYVWKAQVGRVPLYLLDSNVPENRPEDRGITRQLYGGDHEMRLRQEIVLGRGGHKLLMALGIQPSCCHINEGHAAFLVLERVKALLKREGLTFDEARESVRATTVFTTHTPVPAGHDRFGEDVMRRHFSDVPNWLGVPWERFWALGTTENDRATFNMSYLAMSFAGFVNGVSRLHGQVSRKLLHPFWPRLLEAEIPVGSITNGVHLPTWTHPELQRLLGAESRPVCGADFAARAKDLDPKALFELRRHSKQRLVEVLRARITRAFLARSDSAKILTRTLDGLDPDALWIGFARRFAPYKRAQLLLRDPERLSNLLDQPDRPVRIVFAGKAHPADKLGQEVLRKVVEASRSERFLGKILFVENYDARLARTLVQGVDVWLNNPTRPLEASGTSGMKVAANGGLNVSVLDGWWIEAQELDPQNGWSIGAGQVYPTQELQDELDSEVLYRLLDEQVFPLWFERTDGVPLGWIERMKHSLATIPPMFDTDRMVGEYAERAYLPAACSYRALAEQRFALARARAERAARIRKGFDAVRILSAQIGDLSNLHQGEAIEVRVEVDPGPLQPEDLVVELVLREDGGGAVQEAGTALALVLDGAGSGGGRLWEGRHVTGSSGAFAWGIRVRGRETDPLDLSVRDLVLWG